MRNIFPKNNSTDLLGKDSDIVKKEDLLPVVEQLQNTIQQLNILSDALQQYKDDNENSITTAQLNAVSAAIQTLQATSANLSNITAETLSVSTQAEINNLTAALATITDLTANNATISSLDATNATIDEATIDELTAVTATIENLNLTNFSATNATITNITSTQGDIDTVNAETVNTDDLNATGDAVIAGDVTASNGNFDGVDADEIATENIHWSGATTIINAEKIYLLIPHFENGQYYFQITKSGEPWLTVETYNSVDNFFVRWSQANAGIIPKIYKAGSNESAQLCFEINNPEQAALNIKYASECATENVAGPASYTTNPITPVQTYDVSYKDGSKFFKNVDLAQQGSTFGTLRQLSTNVISAATDDVSYDATEDVSIVVYKPNQSLNTTDDVEFNEVTTTWLGVKEFETKNFVATSMATLNTIDLTKYDDGSLIVVRIGSTSSTNAPSAAYIKQTSQGLPVLYSLVAAKDMPTQAPGTNKPLIWSPVDNAIIEGTNYNIVGTITVAGIASFGNNVLVAGTLSVTGTTTLGDADVTGDLDVAGDTSLKDTNVDGKLVTSGDAVVHGDLYVDGTTHTITEEQVNTTSNTLTLRQNNNSSLGATYAGIIVNKYNGTEDLAIVTDSDGTLRVGTGTGTETAYTDIYWDDVTDKWYSDAALTTEVSPLGSLTSWQSIETLGDVKHYINAVFTQINFTGLVPIMARDEEADMEDKSLLQWDATNVKAKTIDLPTNNNQVLTSVVTFDPQDPTTITDIDYEWKSSSGAGGLAFVGTRSEYNIAKQIPEGRTGYIPAGAMVVITDENDFVEGDNQ